MLCAWLFHLIILLAVTSSLIPAHTASALVTLEAGENYLTGTHSEQVEDLRVRAKGGFLSVRRRLRGDQRLFFPERDDIRFVATGGDVIEPCADWEYRDGKVLYKCKASEPTFVRNGVKYLRAPGSTTVYQDELWSRETLTQESPTTLRWENLQHEWARFERIGTDTATYAMSEFSNANDVRVRLVRDGDGNVVQVLDHDGKAVLHITWKDQQVTGLRDAAGRTVEYHYTGALLTTVIDVRGQPWLYSYDKGFLSTKTTPEGIKTWYECEDTNPGVVKTITVKDLRFASDNQPTAAWQLSFKRFEDHLSGKTIYRVRRTSPAGVLEVTDHYANGKVYRKFVGEPGKNEKQLMRSLVDSTRLRAEYVEDHARRRITWSYDEWSNVNSVEFPDGSKTRATYIPNTAFVKESVDELGVRTTYAYDRFFNRTREVHAAGSAEEREVRTEYDALGRVVRVTVPGDDHTATMVTRSDYDDGEDSVTVTDPDGAVTKAWFDAQGNVVKRRDARNHDWLMEYDPAGNLIRETDPLGQDTEYQYDRDGYLRKTRYPDGREVELRYDFYGNVVESLNAKGHKHSFRYRSDGQLVEERDESGRVVQKHQYDAYGRHVAAADMADNITVYRYDTGEGPWASPTGIAFHSAGAAFYEQSFSFNKRFQPYATFVQADGQVSRSETKYDAAGRPIAEVDPLQKVSSTRYNLHGEVVGGTNKKGDITTTERDRHGRVTAVWIERPGEARRLVGRFSYYASGKLKEEIRPLGQTWTYAYHPTGELKSLTDSKGQSIRYDFDGAGRMVSERWFASLSATEPAYVVSYEYDANGNVVAWDDGAQRGESEYDANGKETHYTQSYGSFSLSYRYEYDVTGQKSAFIGADGVRLEYRYDQAGRLTSLGVAGQLAMAMDDYKWNRPRTIYYPGAQQFLNYNGKLQLADSRSKSLLSTSLQHEERNVYNLRGELTQKTENGLVKGYQYDAESMLTGVTENGSSSESFAYDVAGNRIAEKGTSLIEHDGNNRLVRYGDTRYQWDDNGNLVKETTGTRVRVFVWDIKNRLVRIEDGAGTVVARYGYDPFNRRVWKEVGGKRTHFFYAHEGLIAETDERGKIETQYGWKPDGLWGTDPLWQKVRGVTFFYHNDHLGTPKLMVSQQGVVVWRGKHAAFGAMQAEVVPGIGIAGEDGVPIQVENNLRFPGQYFDAESGFSYNWNRYYDAWSGRYVSEDPDFRFVAQRVSANMIRSRLFGRWDGARYSYSRNSPLMYVDNDGRFAFLPYLWGLLAVTDGFLTGYFSAHYIHDIWVNGLTWQNGVGLGLSLVSPGLKACAIATRGMSLLRYGGRL